MNPKIAIPMAIRWLFRKKRLAEGKLGRPATAEEIILEYKGLLKSKSNYKKHALDRFKDDYGKLKKSNCSIWVLFFLLGCSSTIYKIDRQTADKTQLLVSPDRITLKCEEIDNYSGDVKDARLFLIYVLDEDETVLTSSPGTILNSIVCDSKISKVMKVIRGGKEIYIGNSGILDEPRAFDGDEIFFSKLGEFPVNGRVLGFQVIWNESGMCYNTYAGDQKPCPNDGFPLTK